MEDFSAINDIITQSIKDSSYITVIISSGVFLVYTLIIQVVSYFKNKTKNKPLAQMAEALKEQTENIVKLNGVLDKTFRDADKKEALRTKSAIELSFNTFKGLVYAKCTEIIIRNNIALNEQLVKDNIHRLVSTEYYKVYSILSGFEVNDVGVETKLKDSWIRDVSNAVIEILFNGQDKDQRIVQLNMRLDLFARDYITYLNNKLFNH